VYVNNQPVAAHTGPKQSYVPHIVFSCFVFCCCGWILGLIAFILALIASDYSGKGRTREAQSMGKASLGVSIAGVIVGTILLIVVIALHVTNSQRQQRG